MSRRTLVLTLAAVLLPAAVSAWHNHLTKSVPAADATVAAPKEIRLWFAETVNPKFSSVSLQKPDSTKVPIGKAMATDDPKSLVAAVSSDLAPGTYTVVWRTAGDDGHAVRGRFSFTVK